MGQVLERIDDRLRSFIEAQPVFFVATAPRADDGHVNVSPKGGVGLFRVTGPHGFAYVDLLGSGIETVAHLRENQRICVMFAAFEGAPRIVRLHGRGRVVQRAEPEFADRLANFELSDRHRQAARTVIAVDVTRISDSCGYAVPLMRFEGEREQLIRFADNRLRKQGEDAVLRYCDQHNAESIDGLAALDPLADG